MNLMASSEMDNEGVVRETGIEVTLQKIQRPLEYQKLLSEERNKMNIL